MGVPTKRAEPELLAGVETETLRLAMKHGLSAQKAALVARGVSSYLRLSWGGQMVYMPKGSQSALSDRDRQIYGRFKAGDDYNQLAAHYRLSERQVRRAVAAGKASGVSKGNL